MSARSRTPLLLTELTVMILVFSLCAAVCLSLFASSRQLAQESRDRFEAVSWCESAAAAYKAAQGDPCAAAVALDAQVTEDGLRLDFDQDWLPTAGEAAYVLTLTQTAPAQAQIAVRTADGQELFSLNAEAVTYGQ